MEVLPSFGSQAEQQDNAQSCSAVSGTAQRTYDHGGEVDHRAAIEPKQSFDSIPRSGFWRLWEHGRVILSYDRTFEDCESMIEPS